MMNLRETEAAKKLGVAVQTLRNWRHVRRGPAYIKFGRNVRYPRFETVRNNDRCYVVFRLTHYIL